MDNLLSDLGVLLAPKGYNADISRPLLVDTPAEAFVLLCTNVSKTNPSWLGEFCYYALPAGPLRFPCVVNADETALLPDISPTIRVVFETDVAWRIIKCNPAGSWSFYWLLSEPMGSLEFIRLLGKGDKICFDAQREKVRQHAACTTALNQLRRALQPWWTGTARGGRGRGRGAPGGRGRGPGRGARGRGRLGGRGRRRGTARGRGGSDDPNEVASAASDVASEGGQDAEDPGIS
jgi:hypothetical protein